MKNLVLVLINIMTFLSAHAQTDLNSTAILLQECLSLNSKEQPATATLYANSGMFEYKQMNILQRIKLADLHVVQVNANIAGYSVDIKCFEENACINFIKDDTANSSLGGTAVQFSDMVLANTFAENLSQLIAHYKTNEAPLVKTLFKTSEGIIPILGAKKTAPTKPKVDNNQPVKEAKEEVEIEEVEKPIAEKKPTAKSKRAEKKEIETDEEEKEVVKKPSKRNTKKEAAENDQEDEEKISPREKRKAARAAETDAVSEKTEEENPPVEKKKASRNKLIEDVNDGPNDEAKSKAGTEFCNQLITILQSGKENKFKNIEGKLTNAETKINDSKVKLKGARKNYLSWYKKERAFIAELKSGNDYELILKDFENMQTQLDECLGAGWDMEDKSGGDEYAKLKTEVKDVEFKKESDETMPTIRVIFLEDNNKFTMFMRVK